jgi:hypothetical protein
MLGLPRSLCKDWSQPVSVAGRSDALGRAEAVLLVFFFSINPHVASVTPLVRHWKPPTWLAFETRSLALKTL